MIPASSVGSSPVDPQLALQPAAGEDPTRNNIACHHEAILKMTAELFPGARIEIGASIDPEIEGDEYFVVSVVAPGSVDELVARDGPWHRRMRAIIGPTSNSYRLDLHVA